MAKIHENGWKGVTIKTKSRYASQDGWFGDTEPIEMTTREKCKILIIMKLTCDIQDAETVIAFVDARKVRRILEDVYDEDAGTASRKVWQMVGEIGDLL